MNVIGLAPTYSRRRLWGNKLSNDEARQRREKAFTFRTNLDYLSFGGALRAQISMLKKINFIQKYQGNFKKSKEALPKWAISF